MDGGITNLLTNETKYVQLKSVNPTLPSAADTTSKYGRLASTYSNNQTLLVTEEVVDDIAAKTTNPASVGSSGVSNAEVLSATELARKSLNGSALSSLKLSMKLANQAAIKAGGVAAIVSGGISAIDNAIALSNDEINLATAVADTTVDTTGGIVSAMAGAWAGAMAGAAVGTIVPGAGNVIGAAAGFLVGLAVGMGAQAVWDKHVQEPAVEFLSEGLGAYEGVAENAKIIGEVALERATEAVTSTAEKAKETISTAVEGATSAVAGFVGNLFGGG
jgi:hypothetical protein